jgi:TolA-binding protein
MKKKNVKPEVEKHLINNTSEEPENYLVINDRDTLLFEKISEYMKGRFGLEDVLNDPDLNVAKNEMKDCTMHDSKFDSDRNFVKNALSQIDTEKQVEDEINQIQSEIEMNRIDILTESWVKEWNEGKNKNSDSPAESVKIKNFVADSLEPELNKTSHFRRVKKTNKALSHNFIRYVSLTAATVGLLILIRFMLPSSDPEKLFKSYYLPFEAKSEIIRNFGNLSNISHNALQYYKSGDYKSALIGFTEIFNKDTTNTASRFFTGITCLATGNYLQSVKLLRVISDKPGEYQKEALWYLGLAYLKTGEKEKSARCFSLLVQSSEYYRPRAEIILRRLK